MKNYDYDDDYGYSFGGKSGSHKLHGKGKKNKCKGHYSKHGAKVERWDSMIESLEDETPSYIPSQQPVVSRPKPQPTVVVATATTPTPAISQQTKFIAGPNTHNIKGNFVDFDRLANMEKIEADYNGRRTYGIKFIFTGTKGLSRTAWFSTNFRERDSVYNTEFAFWKSLDKAN